MSASTVENGHSKCDVDSIIDLGSNSSSSGGDRSNRCLTKVQKKASQSNKSRQSACFRIIPHQIILIVLLCLIVAVALTACFLVHHPHVPQVSISLSISKPAVKPCYPGSFFRRTLEAAAYILAPKGNEHPPCMTSNKLFMTDKDSPLGPLTCNDEPSEHDFDADQLSCQRPGFRLTEHRDGVEILQPGVYNTQSSVTFLDEEQMSYASSSIMVNGKIRLDCAVHSAHNYSVNPFTACRLNGILRLNRGDIVRFYVRSSRRLVNPHGSSTNFFLYKLV